MDVKPPTNPNAADDPEQQVGAAPTFSDLGSTSMPNISDSSNPVSIVVNEPATAEQTVAVSELDSPAAPMQSAAEPIAPLSTAPNAMQEPANVPQVTVSASTPETSVPIVVGGGQEQSTGTPASTAVTPGAVPPSGKGKKRWVLPVAVIATLALLGSAAYAYLVYLPNRPNAVYNKSMVNTGKAVDVLVDYTNDQAKKGYKGADYTVALKGEAEGSTMSMDMHGSTDTVGNATASMSADVLGQKFSGEVRSLSVKGSVMPDIYFKVSGVKKVLDNFGMPGSAVEGQWIALDHKTLESYTEGLQSELDASSVDPTGLAQSLPTTAQAQDAMAKMQQVNKQYLFTDDADKSVITNKKFVAKETQDGRSVYHYTVGYNKDHLAAYVTAVGKALDSSKLNDWAKKMSDGQDISKAMNLDDLKKSAQDTKGDYTFDMWVDAKTKLVSALKFADTEDKNVSVTISQGYTGSGTAYPFKIKSESKNKDEGTMELGLTIDTSSNKVSGTMKLNTSTTKVDGTMSVTPTTKLVNVTAPTGTKPLDTILKSFGLSQDSLMPSTSTSYSAVSGLFGSSL